MTDEKLTAIYNEANGLDPKRHNPITTERIFSAMRAAAIAEREACAKVCEATGQELIRWWGGGQANAAAKECADAIRMRSNAIELTGSPLAASPATGGSDVE